jgi:hypothetical protein
VKISGMMTSERRVAMMNYLKKCVYGVGAARSPAQPVANMLAQCNGFHPIV